MKNTFPFLAVQCPLTAGSRQENLEKLQQLIASGLDGISETACVLLPELAPSGYNPSLAASRYTEEQDGHSFRFFSRVAARHKIYLGYSYAEDGGAGKVHNSLMLIGPDGNAVANYRKLHLTKVEKRLYTAGSEVVVADTELGKLGLMICWDMAFPELARMLTLRGADLLLCPAAWDAPHADLYRCFARMRALENTVFMAVCNHAGSVDSIEYFGGSSVYGPNGDLLASAAKGELEAVVKCAIASDLIPSMREGYYTMLEDRRSDLY